MLVKNIVEEFLKIKVYKIQSGTGFHPFFQDSLKKTRIRPDPDPLHRLFGSSGTLNRNTNYICVGKLTNDSKTKHVAGKKFWLFLVAINNMGGRAQVELGRKAVQNSKNLAMSGPIRG